MMWIMSVTNSFVPLYKVWRTLLEIHATPVLTTLDSLESVCSQLSLSPGSPETAPKTSRKGHAFSTPGHNFIGSCPLVTSLVPLVLKVRLRAGNGSRMDRPGSALWVSAFQPRRSLSSPHV